MTQKIDISTSTLIRFIVILLSLGFIYVIRDVLVLLFLVIIIVASLSPTVDRWAKLITRPGAVISVFVLLALALVGVSLIVIPPLVDQIQQFAQNLPGLVESYSKSDSSYLKTAADVIQNNLSSVTSSLSNLGGTLFSKTLGVVSGIVAAFTVLVLTFYLLLEEGGLQRMYRGAVPEDLHARYSEMTKKIAAKLGAWLRGQLLLMLLVGILTTIGLLIIGSPYALTLGVWAGLTEGIPFIGPLLGAVPGVAVNLAESPIQGILSIVIYLIVQQLENQVLVPKVMGRAVGLNPVIVILAILIGQKLYGLFGVVLAVPLAAVISVVVADWQLIKDSIAINSRKPKS